MDCRRDRCRSDHCYEADNARQHPDAAPAWLPYLTLQRGRKFEQLEVVAGQACAIAVTKLLAHVQCTPQQLGRVRKLIPAQRQAA